MFFLLVQLIYFSKGFRTFVTRVVRQKPRQTWSSIRFFWLIYSVVQFIRIVPPSCPSCGNDDAIFLLQGTIITHDMAPSMWQWMHYLPDDIHKTFMKDQAGFHLISGLLNGIWTDTFIQCTWMRHGHGPSGVTGLTKDENQMKEDLFPSSTFSDLTSQVKMMSGGDNVKENTTHKEKAQSRISSEREIKKHRVKDCHCVTTHLILVNTMEVNCWIYYRSMTGRSIKTDICMCCRTCREWVVSKSLIGCTISLRKAVL